MTSSKTLGKNKKDPQREMMLLGGVLASNV